MFDRKAYDKQYRIDNKKKRKEYMKQWTSDNREHKNEYTKQWRKNNPEYKKQWREDNPEKVLAMARKDKNKRKRNLGFNPLNKFIKGLVAHHINLNDVIYIPKKIHQGIAHCLETGKNMKEINDYAMAYMKGG